MSDTWKPVSGSYGKHRDGTRTYGPLIWIGGVNYPWSDGERAYDAFGWYSAAGIKHPLDLIGPWEEADNAPEPAARHWKDACRETNGPEICDEPCARCAAPAAGPAPEPAFSFDRYINGQLMAEGVTIEKQPTLPQAMAAAAKIASRGPNGEVPVLVYACAAPAGTPMVACPHRDPLLRTAADQERG